MSETLDAIFQRRAVKVFEPVEISEELREQIVNAARHAPSSFNLQPYKFYWVQSDAKQPLVFHAAGQSEPITMAPLYTIFQERYAVYWKVNYKTT